MRILVFDNYDSFTYNLVHIVSKFAKGSVDVFKNDEIELEQIDSYDKIILSPGPGLPATAGILLQVIQRYAASKSILGVCLGHQAIGQAFGGNLLNLPNVYHGISSLCSVDVNNFLFKNLPAKIEAGRYHSWVIDEPSLPTQLFVTARDENNTIMAIQHNKYDVAGVQFHPESILTPAGEVIIQNWLTGH